MAAGDLREGLRQGAFELEKLACGQGVPGEKADAALFAPIERGLVAAVCQRVAILHGDDGDNPLGLLDFGGRDFAKTDVADFALRLKILESAERLFKRGTRIN